MHVLNFNDRQVSTIFLVDDDPDVRSLYDMAISSLEVNTREVESVPSIDGLVEAASSYDGFICDFLLSRARYSPVNGDVIVSSLYRKQVPAVLCSRAAEAASSVRRYRHSIPCVLSDRELTPENVRDSFSICVNEFGGLFTAVRKPWNALVRVESVIGHYDDFSKVAVVIPSWDHSAVIEMDISPKEVPLYNEIVRTLNRGDMYRCKARVNLDAQGINDIYMTDWVSL